MDFGLGLPNINQSRFSVPKIKPIRLPRNALPTKREIARNLSNKRIREPIKASLRHELMKRAKDKCEWKGCKEKNYLDIHHKDMKNDHNTVSNLVVLCPTHHRAWHDKYKRVVKRDLLGNELGSKVVHRSKAREEKAKIRREMSPFGNMDLGF